MKPVYVSLLSSLLLLVVLGALFPDFAVMIIAACAVFFVFLRRSLEEKELKKRKNSRA